MPMISDAVATNSSRAALWRRPQTLVAVVALVHAVSPLVVLGTHWWFGIDETVYLSQLNAHVPAGLFSAPRARGSTLLAAPVTLLASSTTAVRLWLAMLSGIGLYLAFLPWARLRLGYAVPLAALLFSTVWVVIFYANTVMPNEWSAYGALAATGLFLCYVAEGRRWQLLAVGLAIAVVALFRPSDALYLGAGLGLSCVLLRGARRHRLAAAAALVVGFAAGALEWIVEAYVRYGGLAARIKAAQGENGGGGVHFAGAAQARVLAGPALCRGSCHPQPGLIYQAWWIGLALLVVGAVMLRRHADRPSVVLVAVVAGVSMAAQYVFAVDYAAPRFLIPAYALFSVPCAFVLVLAIRSVSTRSVQLALGASVALTVIAHTAIQLNVITQHLERKSRHAAHAILADGRQLRRLGARSPCLVLGEPTWNQEIAYVNDCSNTKPTPIVLHTKVMGGTALIWLTHRRPVAWRGMSWRRVELRRVGATSLVAYLGSRTGATAPPTPATARSRAPAAQHDRGYR